MTSIKVGDKVSYRSETATVIHVFARTANIKLDRPSSPFSYQLDAWLTDLTVIESAPWCAPLTVTEANLVHSMIVDGMRATRKLVGAIIDRGGNNSLDFDTFMELDSLGIDLSAHAGI